MHLSLKEVDLHPLESFLKADILTCIWNQAWFTNRVSVKKIPIDLTKCNKIQMKWTLYTNIAFMLINSLHKKQKKSFLMHFLFLYSNAFYVMKKYNCYSGICCYQEFKFFSWIYCSTIFSYESLTNVVGWGSNRKNWIWVKLCKAYFSSSKEYILSVLLIWSNEHRILVYKLYRKLGNNITFEKSLKNQPSNFPLKKLFTFYQWAETPYVKPNKALL